MAERIVAGNWKMNLDLTGAKQLVSELVKINLPDDVNVMIFPSALYLPEIVNESNGRIKVGAQNFSQVNEGALTGEISIPQIKSVGGSIGLIGHSERRGFFKEDNLLLKEKVSAAVDNNFDFIFCCGEPLMYRESGKEKEFVLVQLMESLLHLTAEQIMGKIIAYEPVWAIGTGHTASADQVEDMHSTIRSWLTEKYGPEVANSISILYGGSCNPANAKDLFACANVDGGLIGGASLKSDDFSAIIQSY